MSITRTQLLSAKKEVETSLAAARELRDQIFDQNGHLDLTRKDANYNQRAFKNRLLAAKWDCEDLEELLSSNPNVLNQIELTETTIYVDACRKEVADLTCQLDEVESRLKAFQKHGLQYATQTNSRVPLTNPSDLGQTDDKQIARFDSAEEQQSTVKVNVFSNALYDHVEVSDTQSSGSVEASKIFSNLERPSSDVFVSPNENELILEMLETGYNNQSASNKLSAYDATIAKVFDPTGKTFVGIILFIIIIIFVV